MCIFDGQKLTLIIFAGFATRALLQELPWKRMTISEATNLDQLGQKTSTPNTNCPSHSNLRGAMQPG